MSRITFSSRIKFILVAVGSAVGLGSIWRFPYEVGENGGSAFILIYLVLVTLIGLPVLIAEIAIGRAAQANVVTAFRKLSSNSKIPWHWVGGLAVFTCILLFAVYTVISGWTTGYIFEAVKGFSDATDLDKTKETFGKLKGNPCWILSFQALFTVLTAYIVSRKFNDGIERCCVILMPLLVLILIFMAVWGIFQAGDTKVLEWLFNFKIEDLFKPDKPQEIKTGIYLNALGLALFNLSIGMGIMLTYGSYVKKDENIVSSAVSIIFFDTLVSILAAIAVFSPIISKNLSGDQGPGLAFIVLPHVFNGLGNSGYLLGILFFFLLTIAALAAAISLLEVPVAYLVEKKKWSRKRASWITALGSFLFLGIPCGLSYSSFFQKKFFTEITWLNDFNWYKDHKFLGFTDLISTKFFLPFIALFITLFVIFIWLRPSYQEIIKGVKSNKLFSFGAWRIIMGIICPLLILLIFLLIATNFSEYIGIEKPK